MFPLVYLFSKRFMYYQNEFTPFFIQLKTISESFVQLRERKCLKGKQMREIKKKTKSNSYNKVLSKMKSSYP